MPNKWSGSYAGGRDPVGCLLDARLALVHCAERSSEEKSSEEAGGGRAQKSLRRAHS